MALIEFKNYTDTTTPFNATNLNNNFNYLKELIDDVIQNNNIQSITQNSAYQHNNIYRGKDITSEWDAGTVSTNIANGTFDDIFIGDYFTKSVTINSTLYTLKFIIADLDTFYGYSNKSMVSTHHAGVIVTGLPTAQMNSSNTTSGGYYSSSMRSSTLATYINAMSSTLGSSHFVSHYKLLTTGINSTGYNHSGEATGCSNSWDWGTYRISLLTESQVYGHTVWSSSGLDTGEAYKQLSLFKMVSPNTVLGNAHYWLRDVVNSTNFATLESTCIPAHYGASNSYGVVPFILLK